MPKCQHQLKIGNILVKCRAEADHDLYKPKQVCGRCWFMIMNGICDFRPYTNPSTEEEE